MTIAFSSQQAQNQLRSLQTIVRRRNVPIAAARHRRILDTREHDICRRIVSRVSDVLTGQQGDAAAASLRAIENVFDEQVVAEHLRAHHKLDLDLMTVFSTIHELAEQTYENKPLTLGAILDPRKLVPADDPVFPRDLFESKKYRALSDGFRSAYHISRVGHLVDFVDLEQFDKRAVSERHYFPEWAESMARGSRGGRCGICLSRHGDILVFDEGTLRFTYRYGRWQYWNHTHLLDLLKNRARAQNVSPATIGRVITAIYRAALDVSFRRTGGLFVLLHNRRDLRKIVRRGDEIGAPGRSGADADFDELFDGYTIQGLPRAIIVELASLDGAIVVDNAGRMQAFAAVLNPAKKGHLRGTEGSRTKAAIGASLYGLSVKVSSDADITVYHDGEPFLEI